MELPHALHRATPSELKARLEAERRGGAFLLFRDGEGAQRIVELGDAPERLTIGRRPSCGVPLPWDPEVSRVHARVERFEDEWNLVDDGRSRNGSFLNGERIHGRSRLRDGDTIRVGRSTLVFRSASGRESMRTETSERHVGADISEAQRRVLTALCRPCAQSDFGVPASNRQIADELVVSVATVKTHLQALFEAFGVRDLPQHQKRAALASRALESGVVSTRDLEAGS
jgi:pSer/pThr/pTyr-binding forkhead associated (FHA) protein